MAKVNFNKTLRDCFGNEIESNGKKQSIKEVVCIRLFSASDGFTEEEKYNAYRLMNRIAASDGAVEIEDKDSVLIKKICEKSLTAGAWGQLVDILKGE